VALSNPPKDSETITASVSVASVVSDASSSGQQVTVSPALLTFTAATYADAQTLTVAYDGSPLVDGLTRFDVIFTLRSDTNFAFARTDSAKGIIIDSVQNATDYASQVMEGNQISLDGDLATPSGKASFRFVPQDGLYVDTRVCLQPGYHDNSDCHGVWGRLPGMGFGSRQGSWVAAGLYNAQHVRLVPWDDLQAVLPVAAV
jgi:hypothetical protein